MTWWLDALVDGESVRFPLAEDGAELGPPAGEGLEFLYEPSSTTHLGAAGDLRFSMHGEGPSYDLAVEDTASGGRLVVTGADLTMQAFCHQAELDAIVVVDGDRGTRISRNLLLVPLGQFRDALAKGSAKIDVVNLDFARVRGAPNGIELEAGPLTLRGLDGCPDPLAYLNTPRAQPPLAVLTIMDFMGYDGETPATGIAVAVDGAVELPDFWLSEVVGGRLADGRMQLLAVGVVRRRREFLLALRTLTTPDAGTSLRQAQADLGLEPHMLEEVELRDSSGVRALTPLPDGRGFLALTEDPLRRWHLFRVDVGPSGATASEIAMDPVPADIRVTAEELLPRSAGDDGAGQDPEASAEGLVTVPADGCRIPLGAFPATGGPNVRVYLVGDGAGADLVWWVSQDSGDGDVQYAVHLRASREVRVRVHLEG
jgi:hypothetical protein